LAFSLFALTSAQFSLLRAVTGLALSSSLPALQGFLLLSSSQPSPIMGAAVVEQKQNEARIWLTILPEFQRQGLASAAYKLLVAKYLKPNVDLSISPWQSIEDDSSRQFVLSLGFTLREEFQVFDADFNVVKLHAKRHFNRLLQRGSIPMQDISCSFGDQVDTQIAQRLLLSDFTNAVNIRLGQTLLTKRASDQFIFGLHWQKRMIGVCIGRFVGNALWPDAYVIEPDFRRGWAHLAIKHLGYELTTAHYPEITRFQFITTEVHRDTNSYARHINANIVGKQSYYQNILEGA
tara:strand:- start:2615 stop:3490 length:876 start_codon:yes stop_codon:yes gene_type:complete